MATGERLTPGRHNRAVLHALAREGLVEAADSMRAAGLDTVDRPEARMTPL